MATFYLAHAVGVEDGTLTPPAKYDGRFVGAKKKGLRANHPAGVAYANGDLLFLCALKAGEQIADIRVISDTTLGTTTLSVGPAWYPRSPEYPRSARPPSAHTETAGRRWHRRPPPGGWRAAPSSWRRRTGRRTWPAG